LAWARSAGAAAALTACAAAAGLVRERTARAEREHPPAGRFVDVQGARLHYVAEGDGPPLVLLHGLGSMVEDFMVSGLVAAARGRYRVIAFDRPGYGHSTRPRGRRWDPARQAALLLEAFRVLDIHRPIVLGHSWGTSVAVQLALTAPGVPRSLVLASGIYFPTLRLDAPFLLPPGIPLVGALLRHTVSPLAGRALWPLWLRMLFSPARVPPAMAALAWNALRPGTLRTVAEETSHVLPTTVATMRRYRDLTLPVVLVAGTRDKYVGTRAHTARLARLLPNRKLLLSAKAGHMVHHADVPLVLQAVDAAAWG